MQYSRNQFFFSNKSMSTNVVVSKQPYQLSKYRQRRYYRRFFRRWRTNVSNYTHCKISVAGFIEYSSSSSVALPPQITFLPDTSTMNITYTLYEILTLSPRFNAMTTIFEEMKVHSAAIKVYKNIGIINQSQYVPNSLYFGFYYGGGSPTYDVMVGSDLCRLVDYNGDTKWYVKFKSKFQNIKEIGDTSLTTLRLGSYSNTNATYNSQPTFNFSIDFYINFTNCKV